jgi:hemolysin activation/secretion protein
MAAPSGQGGGAANQQDIARSLLIINDLPGIRASSTLEPGEAPGTAKLVVDAQEGPLLGGRAWADNYGERYTGSWRGSGLLQVNDPFRYGDQVTLNTTDNLNYQYGQAGYAFPIGYSGLRAGVLYNEMNYRVDKDLLGTSLNGGARVFGAVVSYPIIRSSTTNLSAAADYNWKNLWDYTSGIQTDNKFINVGSVHLYGDHRDTLFGGGFSTASLGLTGGSLDLSAVKADLIEDQLTAESNGAYGKFTYQASRLQKVYESLNLFVTVNGQLAKDNLDTSEQFILGGPNGVRAYPVGEASGDSGGVLTTELRYDFPEIRRVGIPQLVGFYDLGWINLHYSPWLNSGTPIGDRNCYTLSGAGIGLNLTKPNLYAIRLAWAAKIGTNPGRSVAGLDADGKSDDNRYWIQAMFMF